MQSIKYCRPKCIACGTVSSVVRTFCCGAAIRVCLVAGTEGEVDDPEPVDRGANRGRKRGMPSQRRGSMGTPSKRGRRVSSGGGGDVALLQPPEPPTTPRIEVSWLRLVGDCVLRTSVRKTFWLTVYLRWF